MADRLVRGRVREAAPGRGDLGRKCSFSPERWACTGESQDSRRGDWEGWEGICQAEQGPCPSGAGVDPGWTVGGRVSAPQTCTRELGGSEVSLPALLPGKLTHKAYLTPPPSSQQRRRRERERLVPELIGVAGTFNLVACPATCSLRAPSTASLIGGVRARDVDPNLSFQSHPLQQPCCPQVAGGTERAPQTPSLTARQTAGVLQGCSVARWLNRQTCHISRMTRAGPQSPCRGGERVDSSGLPSGPTRTSHTQ